MRIYVDSAPVIYWVEKIAAFYAQVNTAITQTGAVLISSDLTHLECLVKPIRGNQGGLIQDFDDFFATRCAKVGLDSTIFRQAAAIRAAHGFRTPDALHLAAALAANCDVFLTNDARLKQFQAIQVDVIQ